VEPHDRETRDRLLDAAARLFGERGFDSVTVRDICHEARANVAAVNYHFGGKAGIYEEVLRTAIRAMQATTEEMQEAGRGQPPTDQLRACIHIFLTRVASAGSNWIHQLMLREVANPTEAFDLVMKEALQPRMAYVRTVIAAIIRCDVDDPRVGLCLMSVQSQLFFLLNNRASAPLRAPRLTPGDADALARHIACFSIAGVRAIARD
jgi:AcrR family transcriptional regulator